MRDSHRQLVEEQSRTSSSRSAGERGNGAPDSLVARGSVNRWAKGWEWLRFLICPDLNIAEKLQQSEMDLRVYFSKSLFIDEETVSKRESSWSWPQCGVVVKEELEPRTPGFCLCVLFLTLQAGDGASSLAWGAELASRWVTPLPGLACEQRSHCNQEPGTVLVFTAQNFPKILASLTKI